MASCNQGNTLYRTLTILPQRRYRVTYVDMSAMFSEKHDMEFATIPTYHTRYFATTSITIGLNTQVSAKVKKRNVQYTASVYYVYRLVASKGIRKYLACLPRGDRKTR